MKARIVAWFLLGAAALAAADAVPQFNAVLSMGREHRFVLVDGGGKASAFLSLGESFAGFALKDYDPKTGILELEHEGRVHRVTLMADAATKEAPPPPVPATLADAEAVLNKMHFEEMLERTLAQQRKLINGQFQQLANRMVSQGVDPAEAAAFQQRLAGEVLAILDPKQLKSDVTKIYSEVFTKQELDQLGAFFSTPLGEMLATKQPAVQERLGGIVQGRMAEIMPRVQKLGAEFAAQQKAKGIGSGPQPAPKK